MIEGLQEFVGGFPEWLQWVAVAVIAMIPFVESYLGTGIGVVVGMNPFVAASAAIFGNLVIVLLLVLLVLVVSRVRARMSRGGVERESTPKREKISRLFERFGVPGVSLLVHPTQISSVVMVGMGANRAKVIMWQVISIVAWAAFTGAVSTFGVNVLWH